MTIQNSDGAKSSRATLWIFLSIGVLVVVAAIAAAFFGGDTSDEADDASPAASTGSDSSTDLDNSTDLDSSTDSDSSQTSTSMATVPETGEPTFTGASLVPLDGGPVSTDPTVDPVIGSMAPTSVGADFAGTEVRIEADGQPKVVLFLAHWCPHCQAELPLVVDLVQQGKLPEGLQLIAVSTAIAPDRDNYPPSKWIKDEGWAFPVIRDSADSALFSAYGGSGLPYALYLNGENEVIARSSGSLNESVIEELWLATADS